ncbi:DUF5677 domain-containing protein [Streptomyces sp. NBC_00162]|uniref:DUF5677 domain-containing protein n=1 Tax=Streptomyces sp. NBC_00162 TaxID=2903629 RepID=UPI00214AC98D|nr:DUF5677 domain-containing protein [Streptomyces sp. NBC_00162]UUU37498.1 DUF5677 domain-containing protein [Streptomyces sp. NBC_00162]
MTQMQDELNVVIRIFFTQEGNKAALIIGNHAWNDFHSLLDRLFEGEGRDAARASRSLYEHLVNYCEVMSSADSAERYLAHRAVTADLLGSLTRGVPLLKGAEHKRERTRLARIKRDGAAHLRTVIARYGSNFKRGWGARNLRDMATAHGYGSGYDVYRLLSQVTHGSAGGVLGTYADITGLSVHRTGPSFDLAVLSYLEGISFFRDFVREVEKRSSVNCSEVVAALNRVIACWPVYRNSLQSLDRTLWPKKPPPGPVALLAMYPSGGMRWFYWDPVMKMVKLAIPPESAEWLEEQAREVFRSEKVHAGLLEEGKPYTVSMHSVPVAPKPGSEWVKASAIFSGEPVRVPAWVKGKG